VSAGFFCGAALMPRHVRKVQTRAGWARIAEINRTINLNIRPVDDMTQYGVVDLWATPLMAFASNAGDCEDYAIAKYVALHEIGIADDDLRLVVVHDRAANEDHAVAAVRYDGSWQILDNRTLDIRRDVDIAEFDPLFVIDGKGVKRMTASAPKPQDPWANVSSAAAHLQFSSGWQITPLLL
jgi:predicted transglutaminase-like cysteine proteinase